MVSVRRKGWECRKKLGWKRFVDGVRLTMMRYLMMMVNVVEVFQRAHKCSLKIDFNPSS